MTCLSHFIKHNILFMHSIRTVVVEYCVKVTLQVGMYICTENKFVMPSMMK